MLQGVTTSIRVAVEKDDNVEGTVDGAIVGDGGRLSEVGIENEEL
jgi:hypothetical protein